jgi:glycosyltransferase involved in cell wall biosynthesis
VKTNLKCVIVGDAPYNGEYIQNLKKTKDPRIIFTGYVFGQGYRELQSNAYFYMQATEVGGTHPALLEGMGHGNCVLANDVPEHREVLGDAGVYFSSKKNGELSEKMQHLLDRPHEVAKFGEKAVARIREFYTWEKVTEAYENLFAKIARREK